jgi:O-antigen/teichoic acid export membrane protein
MRKVLAQNYTSYIFQVANGISPSIVIFFLPRIYSLGEIGEFFYYVASIGLYQVLIEFGFTMSGIRECNLTRDADKTGSLSIELLLDITIVKSCLSIIALLLMLALSSAISFDLHTQIFCLLIASLASISNTNWFLFSYSISYVYSVCLFIIRVPIFLTIIMTEPTPLLIAALWFAPNIFSGLLSYIYIKREFGGKINWRSTGAKLRVSGVCARTFRVFITSSAVAAINLSWPVLISTYVGNEAAGAFGIADKIVRGLVMFFSPVQLFLMASKNNTNPMALFNKNYIMLLIPFIAIAPQVIMIANGEVIISKLLGSPNFSTSFLIIHMSILYFLIINMLIYVYMLKQGREVQHATIYVCAFPISILLTYLFGQLIYTPLVSEIIASIALGLYLTINSRSNSKS